ncbi:F0F1 ATP synthase subunit A [candidate division KSB1 bacterium]|nr:F0F1 ATP synthase subunit A [candidate division KSB1 bacterium]
MNISPDSIIYWQYGPIVINATIVFTWAVMAILVLISWLVTRKLTIEGDISRWQGLLETIVAIIREQVRQIMHHKSDQYLAFLGTLFLFISLSNLLAFVPGYHPPTGSIYTTSALAICVFFAVPYFGIVERGLVGYLRQYIKPVVFMLPFNIIGELSRTLAMAVRLFGNIMSGTMIVGILISLSPLFLPIVMQAFGLLIGQIQAYIFAVLAAVYIASATRERKKNESNDNQREV